MRLFRWFHSGEFRRPQMMDIYFIAPFFFLRAISPFTAVCISSPYIRDKFAIYSRYIRDTFAITSLLREFYAKST